MSSESEMSDNDNIVPTELFEAAKNVTLNLLPETSRKKYAIAYHEFKKWLVSKNTRCLKEEILIAYFDEISKNLAPSTLWSRFSMLKCTLSAYNDVNIGKYMKLIAFLKKKNVGHKGKKAKILTATEISKFLNEAPDDMFLATKAVLAIGVAGACRRDELVNITIKDIEDHDSFLLVRLPQTKTKIVRSFTVDQEFYAIFKKYLQQRPAETKSDRVFLTYRKGKCTSQPIGINTIGGMPKEIASYLKLPNAECYTGHTFRRTSATLLSDAGADITVLKRHGGWRSNAVAEGYIEDSLMNKRKIATQIVSDIAVKSPDATASTSRAINEPISPKRLKLSEHPATNSETVSVVGQMSPDNSIAEVVSKTVKVDNSISSNRNIKFEFNNCNVTIINNYNQNEI